MAKKSNKAAVAKSTAVVVAGELHQHDGKVVLPVAQKQEEVNAPVVVVKADLARKIFEECYAMDPVPQRKIILARFEKEAGLTKHGAATYLQNMKKKAGYVTPKTPAVATAE